MLTDAYHGAMFERQKKLGPRDLERVLYPKPAGPQSDSDIERSLSKFFDRHNARVTGNGG